MSGTKTTWVCTLCGYVHEGDAPPETCPVCGVGAEYFERCDASDEEQGEISAAFEVPLDGPQIVIVGGGIAALSAAESARATHPRARITLLAGEPGVPYRRVNLTRYLAGEISAEALAIHSEAWFNTHRIELRSATEVQTILPEEHAVVTRSGERLSYDRLVLAHGSYAFMPPFAGNTRRNVMTLRTRADAERILTEIPLCRNAVVIGGGLLGIETAAALARHGIAVTVVETAESLLPRQLNPTAGAHLAARAAKIGLAFVYGKGISRIDGDDRVAAVVLDDGTELPADLVVVSTGVRPSLWLARTAGLNTSAGIEVDDTLCTSHPDVFAAGDGVCHHGRLYGLWDVARIQGTIAGQNAVSDTPVALFHEVPLAASLKVMGVDMFSMGDFLPPQNSADSLCFEEVIDDNYYYFQFNDGRLCGVNLIGDLTCVAAVRSVIETRTACVPPEGVTSAAGIIEHLQRIEEDQ